MLSGMKRVFLAVFGIVLVSGGVIWWFLRDTPQKAVRDGLRRLMEVESIALVVGRVAWTNPETRVTTGFDFVGQLDTQDLTRPRALGALRLGEGLAGEEQIEDIILEKNRLARRRGVRSGRFTVVNRNAFLKERRHSGLVAGGKTEDVRETLPALIPTVRASESWKKTKAEGNRLVTVPFTLEGNALRPFLIALLRVWHNDALSPDELALIDRASLGLSRGQFQITVRRDTRVPTQLRGEWPLVDIEGKERLRLRFQIDLAGINRRVSIVIPADAEVDREKIAPRLPQPALPSSPSASGTLSFPITLPDKAIRMINEKDVDLFHKYLEEMKRKKM